MKIVHITGCVYPYSDRSHVPLLGREVVSVVGGDTWYWHWLPTSGETFVLRDDSEYVLNQLVRRGYVFTVLGESE